MSLKTDTGDLLRKALIGIVVLIAAIIVLSIVLEIIKLIIPLLILAAFVLGCIYLFNKLSSS
jgi:hypothetical protein